MLVWYFLLYSIKNSNNLFWFSTCRQAVLCCMMYYSVSRECVVKVYAKWFWGRGKGSYMNHSLHAGNKVHFLSRQTISQPLQDMAGPPDINLHGGILFLPREGEGGQEECFDLNGSIYHTCSSILKDNHVRKQRVVGGGVGWHGINMCGLSMSVNV